MGDFHITKGPFGSTEPLTIAKSFTLEEVEALLTAERERCAKVAASWAASDWPAGQTVFAIAAAIRSLAPQTIGDE